MTNLPSLLWATSPNFSGRAKTVTMVILHDTEGSYDGAISWFRNPSSQVSAHIVLREDGAEATQMVKYGQKAWHAEMFNSQAIGIEMAGVARLGFRAEELRRAARVVAFFLHKYYLPAVLLSEKDAVAGHKGWTAHQCLGVSGGGHHDPGFSKQKMWWFNSLVAKELKAGGFRPVWGED